MSELFYAARLNQRMNNCVGYLPLQWSQVNFHSECMTSYLRKSVAFKVLSAGWIIGFLMLAPSHSAIQIVAVIAGVNIVFIGIFCDYFVFQDGQALVTSANFLLEKYQSLGPTQCNITMFPAKIPIYFNHLALYFYSRRFSSISTNEVLHHSFDVSKFISLNRHLRNGFYNS